MQLNVTPGAILELRAAKANGGISQGINSPLTTTWYDTSGNGNNGTLTGFTGQTPWSGTGTTGDPYALDHTSTSGPRGVLVPASTSLNLIGSSSFTSEIIVKLPPIGINPQWFMGRGAAYGALGFGFVAWDAVSPTPYMQFYYGDGAHGLAATNFGYLPRGTRLHLAVVINRSNATVRSFLDGEFVDQQSIAGFGSFLDVADSLDLLNTNYGAFGGTPKSVYLARLYPFALTSDQIGENYDAGVN
jgi:hypothetical protein